MCGKNVYFYNDDTIVERETFENRDTDIYTN